MTPERSWNVPHDASTRGATRSNVSTRRRERKARNRRITAGVVALFVAIGGSYAAFSVFRDSSGGTIGAEGDSGFHALWPEVTLAEAQAVQDQLDAGDPDPSWRLDAGGVAGQFAHESLGWDGISVQEIDSPNASYPGAVEVLVQHVTAEQALASASPVPAWIPQRGGALSLSPRSDRIPSSSCSTGW